MSESQLERFLAAIDALDADALTRLMAEDCTLLIADGRRAEGTEAVRALLGDLLAEMRSTSHRITSSWTIGDVQIAEVECDYTLQNWLELKAVPRAFFATVGDRAITELRVYGAHERALATEGAEPSGMRIGGRWMPPL